MQKQIIKKSVSVLLGCVMLLSGCTQENVVTSEEMEGLEALTFEEIAAGNTDSADVRDSTVYQYVTDTVTIDTNNLVQVNETEAEAVDNMVHILNNSLVTGDTTYVDASILNYMLWEFAATPYTWDFVDYEIKGIDAATRLYFVDLEYKTTDVLKTQIPESLIVRGDPNEQKLKEKRYTDYLTWLKAQNEENEEVNSWERLVRNEWASADALKAFMSGLQYDSVMFGYTADAEKQDVIGVSKELIQQQYGDGVYINAKGDVIEADKYTFEDRWGTIEDIFATQNGTTMVARLQQYSKQKEIDNVLQESVVETDAESVVGIDEESVGVGQDADTEKRDIGVYTYAGLTEVAKEYGATMKFRVVLKYVYSIGTENSMSIQSMYLYDYNLDNIDAITQTYTTEEVQNGNVLKPFIQRTLKAYRKAIEEANHTGLYNLFVTYDKYDMYVADLVEYCYISNGGFSVDVIGRKGDEVAVMVTQRTKKRAKGTYMSMPTYQETVLVKVKLCTDDTVKIVSLTPLQVTLLGEPLSIIRNVKGVSEQIAFDSTAFSSANAVAVEQTIANFLKSELNYNGTDLQTADYEIVDLGISATEKETMLNCFDAVKQINAQKVGVWLTNYSMKSNVYCTVNLREVFVGENSNLDTEATISLLNRNGVWKVIAYSRTMCVATNVQDIGHITDTALAVIDLQSTPVITYIVYTKTNETDTRVDLNTAETENGWNVEEVQETTQEVLEE